MEKKDLFSGHSKIYAAFRPTYPEALYSFLLSRVKVRSCAWDCATGNGQVAQRLAREFETVHATDISGQQIQEAVQLPNIKYEVQPAESTAFPDSSFDLITVGQALHWFNFHAFFREVVRVAKPGALFAAWGYGNIVVDSVIDPYISRFYEDVVGPYWDERRRFVENGYADITFPFKVLNHTEFAIEVTWTLQQLEGYLESWSATQAFIKAKKVNPVPAFSNTIKALWHDEKYLGIRFPLFLKAGYLR